MLKFGTVKISTHCLSLPAECDPNDSLSEPVLDNSLTQEERILAITEFFGSRQSKLHGVDSASFT